MADSYILTFSTGNEIDKRIITGRIYDDKPSGTMIFAYKLKADTVNPSTTKPDYISQAGNNGFFQLAGLGFGNIPRICCSRSIQGFILSKRTG